MDVYFLDNDLREQFVLDSFKSLIWTKRYYTYGDFELYVPASADLTNALNGCPYIMRDDDESVMVLILFFIFFIYFFIKFFFRISFSIS